MSKLSFQPGHDGERDRLEPDWAKEPMESFARCYWQGVVKDELIGELEARFEDVWKDTAGVEFPHWKPSMGLANEEMAAELKYMKIPKTNDC